MLITQKLVLKALSLAEPSAVAVLEEEGTTWGPIWVNGYVRAPGLDEDIEFTLGDFDDESDEDEFWTFAKAKLEVASRYGVDSGIVAIQAPWLLQKGENLYAGAAHYQGITVATSGANEEADEALARIVLDIIVMLALLEAKKRRTSGNDEDLII